VRWGCGIGNAADGSKGLGGFTGAAYKLMCHIMHQLLNHVMQVYCTQQKVMHHMTDQPCVLYDAAPSVVCARHTCTGAGHLSLDGLLNACASKWFLIVWLLQEFGQLDILISNAAVSGGFNEDDLLVMLQDTAV